jgi:hypothetical protein
MDLAMAAQRIPARRTSAAHDNDARLTNYSAIAGARTEGVMIRKVIAWLVLCFGVILGPFASILISRQTDAPWFSIWGTFFFLVPFLICVFIWIVFVAIADSISPFPKKPRDQSGQPDDDDDLDNHDDTFPGDPLWKTLAILFLPSTFTALASNPPAPLFDPFV